MAAATMRFDIGRFAADPARYHRIRVVHRGKKGSPCGLTNKPSDGGSPVRLFPSRESAEAAGFVACRTCFGG